MAAVGARSVQDDFALHARAGRLQDTRQTVEVGAAAELRQCDLLLHSLPLLYGHSVHRGFQQGSLV